MIEGVVIISLLNNFIFFTFDSRKNCSEFNIDHLQKASSSTEPAQTQGVIVSAESTQNQGVIVSAKSTQNQGVIVSTESTILTPQMQYAFPSYTAQTPFINLLMVRTDK